MASTAPIRSTKFLLVRALRVTGLLRFADACKAVLARSRVWRANRDFHRRHPDFATPPRHLAFDALNHFDWERYRASGRQHAQMFARVLDAAFPPNAPLEILEWGCGPGRLIRHIAGLLPGRQARLSGADYNAESIAWCRQHLPGIQFVANDLAPPLPFADGKFDAIYTFSVFTHLSEPVQLDWARELHRVLKPGGLLICTTHGDAYRYLLTADDEREAFDAGRLVVQGGYQEGKKWFLAIHPRPFVREHLLAGWTDVERIEPRAEDGVLQDVWVARKATHGRSQPVPSTGAASSLHRTET